MLLLHHTCIPQVRLRGASPEHFTSGVGHWRVDGGRGSERCVGEAVDDTRTP